MLVKKKKIAPYYNIDDLDYSWIATVNEERECLGQVLVEDWMLEKVISTLEYLTYVKMREKIKEIDMQSLEFDENARCDICLSVCSLYYTIIWFSLKVKMETNWSFVMVASCVSTRRVMAFSKSLKDHGCVDSVRRVSSQPLPAAYVRILVEL